MNKSNLHYVTILVVAAAAVLTAGVANAMTIGTFADPTIGGPDVPMFAVVSPVPGFISVVGAWSGSNLDLHVANNTYTDATMSFSGASGIANGVLGAGTFDFYDSSSNPVFKVTFDSALVAIGGLAGDNIFSNNNVQFSGPAVALLGPLTNQSFSFSFGNQTPIPGGFTATAAFTSSATLIPEPATIFVLALGSVIMAVRRRR